MRPLARNPPSLMSCIRSVSGEACAQLRSSETSNLGNDRRSSCIRIVSSTKQRLAIPGGASSRGGARGLPGLIKGKKLTIK